MTHQRTESLMRLICPAILVGAMFAGAARAQEPQASPPQTKPVPIVLPHVDVPTLDGTANLIGHLFRPRDSGDAPRPAVVMMHGCSGLLGRNGRFRPIYRAWARALLKQGYVVLVVDSTTSRGFGETCSASPARRIMWRDRPGDTYAALAYLQAQPFVRADRIGLMGWSQGGGAVLVAINERTAVRLSKPGQAVVRRLPHDFAAAVAFYPGICSEKVQRLTYPPGEHDAWTSHVPLLVLMGGSDVWTEPLPCAAFLDAARARGNPIEMKTYPGAFHAFDAPNLKRTELPQYRTFDGRIPVIGTDEAARADAFVRVPSFLAAKLSRPD